MRLTFALGVAVMLICAMIGEIAPSLGEESVERDDGFFSADDQQDDSSPEGAADAEKNRESEWLPEVGLGAGALEVKPTIEKRGQAVWENAWVKGYRPNRRAFSPWGGKRYFNPWGGKRFKGIYLERKANSIFDKRPGFQPWGGKRAAPSQGFGSAESEKRAFSPWGGKRESSRDQNKGLLVHQRLNENNNLLFQKP